MEAIRAAGALGAWVDVDLGQVARSASLADELAEALVRHEVLFARDQTLAPNELKRLAERFGEIEPHPAYPTVAEVPEVQILESTAAAPTKIEAWHSDMTFRAQPPGVTLLLAETVPAFGGDTLWASASAAYEGLSAPMRNLVDGLAASHDFAAGFKESLAEPGGVGAVARRAGGEPAGQPSGGAYASRLGAQGDLCEQPLHHPHRGGAAPRERGAAGLPGERSGHGGIHGALGLAAGHGGHLGQPHHTAQAGERLLPAASPDVPGDGGRRAATVALQCIGNASFSHHR